MINYDRDREVAMASRKSFRELLKILYQDAGLKKIHVIAHSMGNQVVVESLIPTKPDCVKTSSFPN